MVRHIQLRTVAFAALLATLSHSAMAGVARFTAFGPPNGPVTTAASLPGSSGGLLLSTEFGGLFRSADRGRSWAWSSFGLGGDTLQAVTPDPSRATTLYGASFGAFYRSDDLGQSWQTVATGQRFGREVEVSLTAAPGRKGQPITLYLAAGQQLFVSHDLGATWPASRTEGFGVAFRAVAFDPAHPLTAYAAASGTGGGLLRSTDTGYTWTHIGPALFSQGLTGFAFVPTSSPVLLASTASGRFFRSTTGGASWKEVPSGLDLTRLLVDPRSPATVYGVFGSGVKVSTDAGATWRLRGNTLADDIERLVVDRATGTLTAFTRFDVFSLAPRAAAWSLLFRSAAHGGEDFDFAARVRFDPADPETVYTVLGARAFRSTDGGGHWTSFAMALGNINGQPGDINDLAVDSGDPDRILLATRFFGLLEISNQGNTFTALGPPVLDELLPLDSHTLLGIDGSAQGGLLRSTDGGATWARVLGNTVRKLQDDPGDPRVVYAAAGNFAPPALPDLFLVKSEDGGATWRTILDGADTFALDSTRPAGLYALQGDRVVRSPDGGATWQPRGLYPDPTQSILLDADLLADSQDPAILYGSSFALGALRSTDGGLSFTPIVLTPAVDPLRPSPPRGVVDERLYADPAVPHRVYLAIARRLYVASF